MQPLVAPDLRNLGPIGELNNPLATRNTTNQILLVPAREDNQFAREIVHTGTHYRGVPLPAILARNGRIGLDSVFVEVVQDEDIDTIARQCSLAPDRQQLASTSDDLDLVSRTDIVGRFATLLDGRLRKEFGILLRLDNALHTSVELIGQRCRIGGYCHSQVGIESKQIGRQQRGRADRFAVLRRHRYDQTSNVPLGKHLQHPIVGAMEIGQCQKGIDRRSVILKSDCFVHSWLQKNATATIRKVWKRVGLGE